MANLQEIERLTNEYADIRELLAERVNALEEEIEFLKRQKLPGIKNTLKKAAEAEARLRAAVEASPGCFVKPKTLVFHGVKVGFQKSKGSIEWDDDEMVIRLIRKHFPEQADILIRLKETPNKDALGEIPATDLKRLGVTVKDSGDKVVIKPVDGEVEKIVNALLKGATGEEAA